MKPKQSVSPARFSWFSNPSKVNRRWMEWLTTVLTPRDRALIADVARLRAVTGTQLERLHFADLAADSRARQRRRVLARLVSGRVLASARRRIGGLGGGSAITIYALDSAGQWLTALDTGEPKPALRPPALPSDRTLAHTLAVTENYVQLMEACRDTGAWVREFATEPRCWWPDGVGGHLKPDAYAVLASPNAVHHWWIEVDLGTEHLPVLAKKTSAYLGFFHRGAATPEPGIFPRVMFAMPNSLRRNQLAAYITALPPPASQLFHVTHHKDAAAYLLTTLSSACRGSGPP